MYNDLQRLGVDVAELKLKANTAIAFMDNFLVIDRSRCKTAPKNALCWPTKPGTI